MALHTFDIQAKYIPKDQTNSLLQPNTVARGFYHCTKYKISSLSASVISDSIDLALCHLHVFTQGTLDKAGGSTQLQCNQCFTFSYDDIWWKKQIQNHCSKHYDTWCEAAMPFPDDVKANNTKQTGLSQCECLTGRSHTEKRKSWTQSTLPANIHMQ